MARNTGRGSRIGAQTGVHGNTMWTRRVTTTGRFLEAKRTGGDFRGVRNHKPRRWWMWWR